MNTHDIELPPLPSPTRRGYGLHYNADEMESYARAAIEAYRKSRGEPVGSKKLYAVACLLSGRKGNQYITSGTLHTRFADSEEEAKGSAVSFALEEKPDLAIDQVLCMEVRAPQPAEPVKVPRPHEFNTGNQKLDTLLDDTFYLVKDGGMDNGIKWHESLEEFLASIEPVKVPSEDQWGALALWLDRRREYPTVMITGEVAGDIADRLAKYGQPAQPAATFHLGDRVRKTKGSRWQGRIVGTYSTTLTPEGYAVESETETGSVQIYPAHALEAVPDETNKDNQ